MDGDDKVRKWFLTLILLLVSVMVFTSCTAARNHDKTKDVDAAFFQSIKGFYSVQWNEEDEAQYGGRYEGFWDLNITEDVHENSDDASENRIPYFSCVDGEAGNPGFEGEIIKLKDNSITIKLDMDCYDGMPFDWEPVNEKYAVLEIKKNGNKLELSSNGKTLVFIASDG